MGFFRTLPLQPLILQLEEEAGRRFLMLIRRGSSSSLWVNKGLSGPAKWWVQAWSP